MMSILKINDQNEIYYELIEPKDNRHTFVFVNALTGNTNAWNGIIGDKITEDGNGFLTYNFRGQDNSKFSDELKSTGKDGSITAQLFTANPKNPKNTKELKNHQKLKKVKQKWFGFLKSLAKMDVTIESCSKMIP